VSLRPLRWRIARNLRFHPSAFGLEIGIIVGHDGARISLPETSREISLAGQEMFTAEIPEHFRCAGIAECSGEICELAVRVSDPSTGRAWVRRAGALQFAGRTAHTEAAAEGENLSLLSKKREVGGERATPVARTCQGPRAGEAVPPDGAERPRRRQQFCAGCCLERPQLTAMLVPWHRRPRLKARSRGDSDEWLWLPIDICLACAGLIPSARAAGCEEGQRPPPHRGPYLIGWDWWDAVDGLETLFDRRGRTSRL